MFRFMSFAFSVAGLVGLLTGFFLWPEPITREINVPFFVQEMKFRTLEVPVDMPDGSVVVKTLTYDFPTYRQANRIDKITVEPEPIETIRLAVVVAFAVLFVLYAVATLVLFFRDKWEKRTASNDSRDTAGRVNTIFAGIGGVVFGFVTTFPLSESPNVALLQKENQALRQAFPPDISASGQSFTPGRAPFDEIPETDTPPLPPK